MSYKNEQISLNTIPVKAQYGIDSTLGRIYAQVNLPTNLGVITGFDANGLIELANDGGAFGGRYYGEFLEVLQSDAIAASWPNNAGDEQFPDHAPSNFLKTS